MEREFRCDSTAPAHSGGETLAGRRSFWTRSECVVARGRGFLGSCFIGSAVQRQSRAGPCTGTCLDPVRRSSCRVTNVPFAWLLVLKLRLGRSPASHNAKLYGRVNCVHASYNWTLCGRLSQRPASSARETMGTVRPARDPPMGLVRQDHPTARAPPFSRHRCRTTARYPAPARRGPWRLQSGS